MKSDHMPPECVKSSRSKTPYMQKPFKLGKFSQDLLNSILENLRRYALVFPAASIAFKCLQTNGIYSHTACTRVRNAFNKGTHGQLARLTQRYARAVFMSLVAYDLLCYYASQTEEVRKAIFNEVLELYEYFSRRATLMLYQREKSFFENLMHSFFGVNKSVLTGTQEVEEPTKKALNLIMKMQQFTLPRKAFQKPVTKLSDDALRTDLESANHLYKEKGWMKHNCISAWAVCRETFNRKITSVTKQKKGIESLDEIAYLEKMCVEWAPEVFKHGGIVGDYKNKREKYLASLAVSILSLAESASPKESSRVFSTLLEVSERHNYSRAISVFMSQIEALDAIDLDTLAPMLLSLKIFNSALKKCRKAYVETSCIKKYLGKVQPENEQEQKRELFKKFAVHRDAHTRFVGLHALTVYKTYDRIIQELREDKYTESSIESAKSDLQNAKQECILCWESFVQGLKQEAEKRRGHAPRDAEVSEIQASNAHIGDAEEVSNAEVSDVQASNTDALNAEVSEIQLPDTQSGTQPNTQPDLSSAILESDEDKQTQTMQSQEELKEQPVLEDTPVAQTNPQITSPEQILADASGSEQEKQSAEPEACTCIPLEPNPSSSHEQPVLVQPEAPEVPETAEHSTEAAQPVEANASSSEDESEEEVATPNKPAALNSGFNMGMVKKEKKCSDPRCIRYRIRVHDTHLAVPRKNAMLTPMQMEEAQEEFRKFFGGLHKACFYAADFPDKFRMILSQDQALLDNIVKLFDLKHTDFLRTQGIRVHKQTLYREAYKELFRDTPRGKFAEGDFYINEYKIDEVVGVLKAKYIEEELKEKREQKRKEIAARGAEKKSFFTKVKQSAKKMLSKIRGTPSAPKLTPEEELQTWSEQYKEELQAREDLFFRKKYQDVPDGIIRICKALVENIGRSTGGVFRVLPKELNLAERYQEYIIENKEVSYDQIEKDEEELKALAVVLNRYLRGHNDGIVCRELYMSLLPRTNKNPDSKIDYGLGALLLATLDANTLWLLKHIVYVVDVVAKNKAANLLDYNSMVNMVAPNLFAADIPMTMETPVAMIEMTHSLFAAVRNVCFMENVGEADYTVY